MKQVWMAFGLAGGLLAGPVSAQTLSGPCIAQGGDQITCSVEVGAGGSITVIPRLISRGALSPVVATAELAFQRGGVTTALGGANTISASNSSNAIGGAVTLQRDPRRAGLVELTIRNCRNGSATASCHAAFPPATATFQLLPSR